MGETELAQMFVDESSLTQQGRYVHAWFRWDYSSPQTTPDGKHFLSDKTLKYFDCALRQSGIRQIVAYADENGRGNVVHSVTFRPDDMRAHMQDVVPETAGETQLNYVCKNAPRPKAAPPK